MPLPIALQLYTVRDAMTRDADGTLAALAGFGLKHVELAGYHGKTPQQYKQLLDKHGLKAVAAHVGPEPTEENIRKLAEEARLFGYSYIVSSGFPGFEWGKTYGRQDWIDGAAKLAKVTQIAAGHGLTYCYHNHSFEFEKYDGGRHAMDILYGDANPPLSAELDVYWVQHGHEDPVAWMKRLSGRVPLLHIKDMEKGPARGFTEVGTGIVDMKTIVANAQACGVKYFILEQDGGWKGGDPVASARISFENFRRLAG